MLNPGWTNYRRSILYNTYEVTSLLHQGANAIGVLVGNGMYNVERQRGRYTKFSGSFGQPKLILELHLRYRDGTEDVVWPATAAGKRIPGRSFILRLTAARISMRGWNRRAGIRPGSRATDWLPALDRGRPRGRVGGAAGSAHPHHAPLRAGVCHRTATGSAGVRPGPEHVRLAGDSRRGPRRRYGEADRGRTARFRRPGKPAQRRRRPKGGKLVLLIRFAAADRKSGIRASAIGAFATCRWRAPCGRPRNPPASRCCFRCAETFCMTISG